jgi:hypothetical protein
MAMTCCAAKPRAQAPVGPPPSRSLAHSPGNGLKDGHDLNKGLSAGVGLESALHRRRHPTVQKLTQRDRRQDPRGDHVGP